LTGSAHDLQKEIRDLCDAIMAFVTASAIALMRAGDDIDRLGLCHEWPIS
jgi:hypothetical protein